MLKDSKKNNLWTTFAIQSKVKVRDYDIHLNEPLYIQDTVDRSSTIMVVINVRLHKFDVSKHSLSLSLSLTFNLFLSRPPDSLTSHSDASLELCVMPKDEDILQLVSIHPWVDITWFFSFSCLFKQDQTIHTFFNDSLCQSQTGALLKYSVILFVRKIWKSQFVVSRKTDVVKLNSSDNLFLHPALLSCILSWSVGSQWAQVFLTVCF